MTHRTKRIILFSLSVTLLSLVLLSSSLSNLQLHAGTPFPGGGDSDDALQSNMALSPMNTYSNPFLRGIFALIFLILMIYVPARLISLIGIKQIFKFILVVFTVLIFVIIISYILPDIPADFPGKSSGITIPPSPTYSTAPLGKPPQELIWFVVFIFMLGAGSLVIKIFKQQLCLPQADVQLLNEAENAVNALKAGEDLRNVILHCYLQMTHALQEEQGMKRSNNMTVREFEDWLDFKGVPRAPVRQLTCLFEKVRYGKQQTSENDERVGVENLNEIIKYCRREKDLSK